MIGERIAVEAREWIGTPFHWQGRVKQVGVDCKGLVAGVAEACGRPEGQSFEALAGDYGLRVDPLRLRAGLVRLFDPVAQADLRAGDVLLLKVGGKPVHLGIALDAAVMVHCYNRGPRQVIAAPIDRAELDSVWRWRAGS